MSLFRFTPIFRKTKITHAKQNAIEKIFTFSFRLGRRKRKKKKSYFAIFALEGIKIFWQQGRERKGKEREKERQSKLPLQLMDINAYKSPQFEITMCEK